MKTKKLLLIPLMFGGLMCIKCSDKSLYEKKLVSVPAIIVRGCFDFPRPDTFSIKLENYPEGIFDIYPIEKIPDEFRIDSLKVFVSGEITNEKKTNQCIASPNVKLTGTNLIRITNIQKKN
jgi:predicted nucleic-acid-binding Zn-ribbon protein